MLLGLDHAIIAVRDLAQARGQLERALGLTVTPGGEHPGMGTHNAIVRLGTEYLEILAVRDPQEATRNEKGRALQEFLAREEGLLGFAISSDNLERDVVDVAARGIALDGPHPGSRLRPDGSLITWKTSSPPGDPWGRRLPFLIQHDTPIQERRAWAPPGGHPLGVPGIPLLSVAVADLQPRIDDYRRLLGEPPEIVEEVPALPARRARFCIGSFRLDLLQPTSSGGGLADFVRRQGDGPFMVSLAVPNVEEAVRFLRSRGTSVADPTPRRRAPLLDPSQTLGARFQLVEAQ
jgi:catechol 2,3-dioxygenase-like lactoylglutathione lyase family enzyme